MPDIEIVCSDCNGVFLFTERDQAFFTQQNFSKPRRCRTCRAVRKAQQNRGGGGGGQWQNRAAPMPPVETRQRTFETTPAAPPDDDDYGWK